jgi:hypothetical protein
MDEPMSSKNDLLEEYAKSRKRCEYLLNSLKSFHADYMKEGEKAKSHEKFIQFFCFVPVALTALFFFSNPPWHHCFLTLAVLGYILLASDFYKLKLHHNEMIAISIVMNDIQGDLEMAILDSQVLLHQISSEFDKESQECPSP